MSGKKGWLLTSLGLLGLLIVSPAALALPFSVLPTAGSTLPTQISTGQTLPAFYTITNLANISLANNYIKYFPQNVTQVTSDGNIPNLCASPFTLPAGGSCTLELLVAGPVNGSDPDPHHHLFACLDNGLMCAGTPSPLNVTGPAVAAPVYAFLAGFYQSSIIAYAPFVLGSFDNGNTWNYNVTAQTASTTPPDGANLYEIGQGACQGNFCFAAGVYLNSSSQTTPYIMQTQNGGKTWGIGIDTALLTPYFGLSLLTEAACSANFCIAAGVYNGGGMPLVAATMNKGQSWSYVLNDTYPTLPPDDGNFGPTDLENAACGNDFCVALGFYTNSSSNYEPLIARSPDGTNWSYVLTSSIGTLPPNFTTLLLTSPGPSLPAACQGSYCVVGTQYLGSNTNSQYVPLIMQSNDKANTWTYAVSIVNEPPNLGTGYFNGTACGDTLCVAGGLYQTNPVGGNYFPLLMQTTNHSTWSLVIGSTSPNLPAGIQSGEFDAINCAGTTCLAAGVYTTTGPSLLLIAVTHTSGSSWQIVAPLPANAPTGITGISKVAEVAVVGQNLVVAGLYSRSSGGNSVFVIQSQDGGATWKYVADALQPVLSDVNGAMFSIGNIAVGLQSNLQEMLRKKTQWTVAPKLMP